MGTSATFTDASTTRNRWGTFLGVIMGRKVTNPEQGLNYFEARTTGRLANDALKFAAEAIKIGVQIVKTITTKPFALTVKEGFAQAIEEGVKDGQKAKAEAILARSRRPGLTST